MSQNPELYVAIGAFIYVVSLLFVWHLGRERMALRYDAYADELEDSLQEARRETFQAQKDAYEADAKLQILQAQYVESRHELHAVRSRLEGLER
jgi:F0F1-type ATP synthase membrane subunit b/b'